jgi:cobalt/nickel transport system permease protein
MMIDSIGAFETCLPPSRLDAFDSRCRVVCALAAAIALTIARDAQSLAAGSVIPALLLLLDWRGRAAFLSKSLANINKIGVFIWIFLPLTYPGERVWGPFSYDGVMAALTVTWKLNLISVVMVQMIASIGIHGISGALGQLGFPWKLRMLLMLTMRYVLLLSGRMATIWRAVCVRSGDIGGLQAFRSFACMVATTLIHSADRAERSSLAMVCRGGMEGFSQFGGSRWTGRDTCLCAVFLLNSLFIMTGPLFIR